MTDISHARHTQATPAVLQWRPVIRGNESILTVFMGLHCWLGPPGRDYLFHLRFQLWSYSIRICLDGNMDDGGFHSV